jgi:hypothetical protein
MGRDGAAAGPLQGGVMQDLGWLLFVVGLFAAGRALVRLCERLM